MLCTCIISRTGLYDPCRFACIGNSGVFDATAAELTKSYHPTVLSMYKCTIVMLLCHSGGDSVQDEMRRVLSGYITIQLRCLCHCPALDRRKHEYLPKRGRQRSADAILIHRNSLGVSGGRFGSPVERNPTGVAHKNPYKIYIVCYMYL